MDIPAFQRAKLALKAKDYRAAERDFKKVRDSMDEAAEQYNIVQSYYGLVQVLNSENEGLLLCRDAASNEAFDGDVFLNLACAEWHSDNRKRAIDAIRHGVKVDATHAQLNLACARLDCRKKSCFSFLPRSHKLNRLFGRFFRRSVPHHTVHSLLY